MGLERGLRDLLRPLQRTPLHPQWMAHRIRTQRSAWLATRATGDALDVGCADRSVRAGLPRLGSYIGLDYPGTAQGLYETRPDVFGDAACLPFVGSSFDCVLMLDVLEHVAEPDAALAEAGRVLRKGGALLVAIPFAYPLHDMPHDYQRLTRPGLQRRIAAAGLTVAELDEAGGGIEAAALNLSLALTRGVLRAVERHRLMGLVALPILAAVPVVNLLGWLLSQLLPAPDFLPGAYFVRAVRH